MTHEQSESEPGFGECNVCGASGRLNARICSSCEEVLGRRTAELVARARSDHDFAVECFSAMNALAQRRFVTMLGDPTQNGEWLPRPVAFTLAGPSMRKAGSSAMPGLAKATPQARSSAQRRASH